MRDYDVIAIEALRPKNMVRRPQPRPDPEAPGTYLPNGASAKIALARMIGASCWTRIATRLTDKAANATTTAAIIPIPAPYTSQTCHHCGHASPENRKSQAIFKCVVCGNTGNADTNAARNILARATGELTTSHTGYAAGPCREQDAQVPTGSVNQLTPA